MSFAYWEYILMGIIVLPGIIFAIYAQNRVNKTYREYSGILAQSNILAKDAARQVLNGAGLDHVEIKTISGNLTDNFNPVTNVVNLSESISESSSIAALGIAMHEVGHALQHNKNYVPAKLRTFAIRFSNITSFLLWPLVIFGLLYNFIYFEGIIGMVCFWAGIGFFGVAVLVNLATLPVEFNASKRALKILETTNILTKDEIPACRKVLMSAALTYVAALLVSILNLLRFILVFTKRKD